MKRYRYFLGGVQLQDDPIGWDEAKWVIFRERTLNALLVRIDLQLEFHGDGYKILADAYDSTGHCGFVDVEIQEMTTTYRRVHQGLIRLSTLTRDRKEFTVKTPIEDNSFYAKISNNKGIAAFPFAERSKNDTLITPCTISYVNYVRPCTCAVYNRITASPYTFTGAHYRSFDLLTYLVSFMTDGAMDFQSTLLDTGGDYEGILWTCGEVIRTYLTGTTETAFKDNFPKLSFEYVFKEINKKVHIGMMIDNTGARPKLVLERDSYFHQSSLMHTCPDIDRVVETTDISKLYSKLILGSSKTLSVAVRNDCNPLHGLSFPERISLLGFKEEEFIILGNCNIDSELNLRSDAVISSNIIEDCLENGASSNDTDPFMVMCEPYYGNWITKTGNLFNLSTPCYFNLDLINIESVQNWIDGIPNQFAQYLSNVDARFQASTTQSYGNTGTQDIALGVGQPLEPVNYSDDFTSPNFDTSNAYGNGTTQGNPVPAPDSRFTAPDDGLYSFSTFTQFNVLSLTNIVFSNTPEIDFYVIINLYDSGNVLLNTYLHHETILSTGSYAYSFNDSFYMSATDYIQVKWQADRGTIGTNFFFLLPAGNTFSCTASATAGGVYTTVNPANYPVIQHQFDKDLTPDDFETILADPRGLIDCTTHKNYSFSAWIEELSFSRAKGIAKWKLFSTFNLNQ